MKTKFVAEFTKNTTLEDTGSCELW